MTLVNKIKSFLIILTFVYPVTITYAAQLANDTFDTGFDGWSGTSISNVSGWLKIERDTTATKTYNLGLANANTPVTIELRLYVPDEWESSGSYQDFFNVLVNGTIVQIYSHGSGTHVHSFTSTLDSAGDITLAFNPNTTANNEYAGVDYVSIDDSLSFTTNNPRDFTKVDVEGQSSTNITGDLLVIGNQSLCWKNGTQTCQQPPSGGSNNSYFQSNANLDPSASSQGYVNSTSANLTLNANDRVVEAWLYWIGRLYDESSKHANANTIQFKTPTTVDYVTLTSDTNKFNWMFSNNFFDYGAAVNVTEYVKQSGTYWVADLQATEMKNQGSGWALAVIVEDTGTNKLRTLKNISLYDGFNGVYNQAPYPTTVNSNISGFLTPKSETVNSNLIIFAGESDRSLGDSMTITKKDGTAIKIKDSLNNTNNVQNGTVSRNGANVTDRNPNYENTLGVDIDEIDVSHIIDNQQTSTTITVNSDDDRIFLSMYGFATELYIPELCYDYVIQKNKYTLPSKDRNMSSYGTGTLSVGVAIRSLEGDFDLERSSLKVELAPSTGVTFDSAFYSPVTVNILIPAINVPHPSTDPNIAIGENATTVGGTISRLQRYFTRFDYTQSANTYKGHFEFDLNTTIDFGSGPVKYQYSTKNNTIKQCPISSIYAPEWGQFNIERTNSDPTTADQIRYPLYTQIVGRDFDVSIVSYDDTHTVPKSISDVTVDVELIDAKPFGDQSFKCNNTFESIIQPLPNGTQSFFVRFPSGGATRVDQNSTTDMITTTALENAAFRIWYLVDENNTIIDHTCAQPTDTNPNDTCFLTQVAPRLNDPTNVCPDSNCSTYVSPRGEQGCYACYRDYFAKPVCSRDNFSIRPESYRIALIDDNENNGSTAITILSNTATVPTSLAAEYTYRIDANATRFQNNINALQYNIDANASIIFNDSAACYDTNDTNITYVLYNGKIINDNRYDQRASFEYNNAGDYLLRMVDKLWTKVDQTGFINEQGIDSKTFPQVDDCIKNNSSTSADGNAISGCDVASNSDVTHTNIALTFEPYKFDISQVLLGLIPNNAANYLFMNDFSDAYYDNNDINMSARFTGLIQAKGKKDRILSNYTNTCHANDKNITLIIARTTAPVDEANLTSIDTRGNRVNNVLFQQKLTMKNASDQLLTGNDQNVTLSGLEFDPTQNGVNPGEALIVLDTTYRKPPVKNAAVNPFDVNYSTMNAISANSSSFADLDFHTPDGNNTFNQTITYYFAKVTPKRELYGPIEESSVRTPFSVDIFCSPEDGNSSICSDRFNLSTISYGQDQEAGWYAATMVTPPELSTVDLTIKTVFGTDALPSVKDNFGSSTNVPIDDPDATQQDINVSLAGAGRPSTVDITVIPAPYLRYDRNDPNGYMHYRVRFIGNSTWSGVGHTGHTVETTSDKNVNPRMNW